MGSKLCNCSFLYDDNEKEENISQIQNQELTILSSAKLKGKPFCFYINKSTFELLPNSHFYNNPYLKIKQFYIINRLKFLSKKIRQFLSKRRSNLMTFATISENNNNIEETNRLNTLRSNIDQNYLNTDTGDIAYKNLAIIKNQNIKQKNIKKYFNELGYSENDGILTIKYEDGTKLEGIFYNNSFNGFTRIFFANKEVFKGEIFDNKAEGYGKYYFIRQGCEYEGYWANNYKSDIGIENWWHNDNYKGEFKLGKKNGIGIYQWQDESYYEGEWMNNNIHGWGIFNNKNKRIYKGHFIMNEMNGYGEMLYLKNEGFYYGYWKDNKKDDFGVEFSPRKNGKDKIYSGFWKNNERNGYGILMHKNKDEKNIMALWKNNKIIKEYKNEQEFFKIIRQNGFDKYLFFFSKNFEEHIKIIKNLKNDDDNNEDE